MPESTPKNIYFKANDKNEINLSYEIAFNDSIPRELVFLSDLLKGSGHELLYKRLSGYQFIQDSLRGTREALKVYLKFTEEEKKDIKAVALWTYAVIQYGKCFKRNEGWTVTLEKSAIIKNESQEIKSGHEWFLKQRDTFIAHGGDSLIQHYISVISRRTSDPKQIDGLFGNVVIPISVKEDALKNLDRLAEISLNYVQEKILELETKIIKALMVAGHVFSSEILNHYNLSGPGPKI